MTVREARLIMMWIRNGYSTETIKYMTGKTTEQIENIRKDME